MKKNFLINNQNGFTILELLVVVAIIAILTGVVIGSIISTKNKAADKAIQENLMTVRSQANIYFLGAGSNTYGNAATNCDSGMYVDDPTMLAAINKLKTYVSVDHVACYSTPNTTFAVAAKLKTSLSYYCVDSTSAGRIIDGDTVATDGLIGWGTRSAIDMNTGLCN